MLIGLGNDLVSIDRIAYLHEKFGPRFLNRIYRKKEQTEIFKQRDPIRRLALHFAAKEAMAKALGTGLREGVQMVDMELFRNDLGQPQMILHGGALKRLKKLAPKNHIHVALTDQRDMALATVIIMAISDN